MGLNPTPDKVVTRKIQKKTAGCDGRHERILRHGLSSESSIQEKTGGLGWLKRNEWVELIRYIYYTGGGQVEFEFDPEKSGSNSVKHGINFEEAQALWLDDRRIIEMARSGDEIRKMIIASIGGKCWTGFYTYRKDRIRIISVRSSRHEEKEHYVQGQ
jgi:uncharacterized DUF497 family protein